jgi:TolB-like protein
MKYAVRYCLGVMALLLSFVTICGASSDEKNVPTTLAILPFENNSITDPMRYAPLGKGLAAMLITDLKNAGTSLKIIERSKITAILKEIAMGQTGAVDEATAIEAGKILGAQSIAFGSYMVMGSQMRIDLRIVKVETSELILAESASGNNDDFITLENQLAQKIAESLKVALQPADSQFKSSMEAALYFSKGLEALDKDDNKLARKMFAKAVYLDPGYQAKVADVQSPKG